MQLVEIEVIRAQPFEAVLAGRVNRLASKAAVTAPNVTLTRATDLAGKYHVAAALALT